MISRTRQEDFEDSVDLYGLQPPEPTDRWPNAEQTFAPRARRRRSVRLGRRLLAKHQRNTRPTDLDPHIELTAIAEALAVGLGREKTGRAWLDRLSGIGIVGNDEIGLTYVAAVWCETNPATSRSVGWGSPQASAGWQRDMQETCGLDWLIEAVYAASRHLPW